MQRSNQTSLSWTRLCNIFGYMLVIGELLLRKGMKTTQSGVLHNVRKSDPDPEDFRIIHF